MNGQRSHIIQVVETDTGQINEVGFLATQLICTNCQNLSPEIFISALPSNRCTSYRHLLPLAYPWAHVRQIKCDKIGTFPGSQDFRQIGGN
jgi:hypothetical protein